MNVDKILNKYNEEDRDYLVDTMKWLAFLGIGNAPTTDEELETWCEKTLVGRDKALAEEKAKAERKANRELAKAEEMGMTVEEYREYKKMVAGKKRHEAAIRKAKEEIAKLEKEIEYEERRVAEYEEKVKKIENRG